MTKTAVPTFVQCERSVIFHGRTWQRHGMRKRGKGYGKQHRSTAQGSTATATAKTGQEQDAAALWFGQLTALMPAVYKQQ